MMLSSLRSRLLVSYLVVIGVCMFLVISILVLVARPVQNRVLNTRLVAEVAQSVPRVKTALRQGVPIERIQKALEEDGHDLGMDLLLVDESGLVLADGSGRNTGNNLAGLSLAEAQGLRSSGSYVSDRGERISYVATAVDESETNGRIWLLGAAPTPGGTPRFFGDLGEGFVVAAGLTFVVAVLLAWLVSRSVAKPMQQMAKAAEAIAAGDYDYVLPVANPAEMRVLGESLESMGEQVKRNQQAMRDLVVNVSHDLKTPLTSIQGFAQALADGVLSDEADQQRAVAIIHEESQRMVRMVEDVVDLARIDSGEMKLTLGPVDMSELAREVVGALALVAEDRQITLTCEASSPLWVIGDRNRLKQVAVNLVDNSLKYTQAGGRVQVACVQQSLEGDTTNLALATGRGTIREDGAVPERWVSLTVIDNGVGIPADDLSRIFERFYRVDKARPSGRGSGLGLAIAREIVSGHGGELRVESVEGIGSRFTVMLPHKAQRA